MNSQLVGALGEYTAALELRKKGYDIFSTNFSTKVGEVDIVAYKKGVVCFVEVKARKDTAMFNPSDAVDYHKQENIRSAAAYYMNKYKLNMKMRFDIFEVYVDETNMVSRINHIENAF